MLYLRYQRETKQIQLDTVIPFATTRYDRKVKKHKLHMKYVYLLCITRCDALASNLLFHVHNLTQALPKVYQW